jgi:hypothetical protein
MKKILIFILTLLPMLVIAQADIFFRTQGGKILSFNGQALSADAIWYNSTGDYEYVNYDNGRYLNCTGSGILWRNTVETEKTWEFDFWCPDFDGNREINFTSDSIIGYSDFNGFSVRFDALNRIRLLRSNGGSGSALWTTATDYVEDSVWYRI